MLNKYYEEDKKCTSWVKSFSVNVFDKFLDRGMFKHHNQLGL